MIIATKAIAAAAFVIPSASYLINMGLLWWRSKLSLWQWIKSRSNNRKVAIVIVSFTAFTLLTYALLSPTLNDQVGLVSITKRFLRVYLAVSITFSTLVTIIPSRFAKLRTKKLKSDLELKKTFVRYISHELRTPLSIVINGLELVKEQVTNGSSADDSLELLHELKGACLTGVDILNELLDYEKLESGLARMDKSVQDPLPLIEATIAPFMMVSRLKGVELRLENHLRERILVDIDETKVRTAFEMLFFAYSVCRSLRCCETSSRTPPNLLPLGG